MRCVVVLVLLCVGCSFVSSKAPTDELSLLQLGGEKNAQTVAKNAGNIPQHQLQPLGLTYPTLITTLPSAGGAARMASWDRGILLPPSRSCTI